MTYTLELYRDGTWICVKSGLTASVAAFGAALEMLKRPGELWRAVSEIDGEVFAP